MKANIKNALDRNKIDYSIYEEFYEFIKLQVRLGYIYMVKIIIEI